MLAIHSAQTSLRSLAVTVFGLSRKASSVGRERCVTGSNKGCEGD